MITHVEKRHHLGFHIRELPLFLTNGKPRYAVARLNEKLFQLVGDPLLDTMTRDYDRLYSRVINLLEKNGVNGLLLASALDHLRRKPSLRGVDSEEAVRFILGTPAIKRRLGDWSALSKTCKNPEEAILTVNGPSFPFIKFWEGLIDWTQKTLQDVEALASVLHPSTLSENPAYVWGAAVTDGFYTDDEMPEAVAFLNDHFGPIRRHPRGVIFLQQAKAIAHLLANYLQGSVDTRTITFPGAVARPAR